MVLENVFDEGFKSEGERRIAELFRDAGIRYVYEQPLLLQDRGKPRIWYPDFALPEQSVHVEYFGMVGNAEYEKGINQKLTAYRENNVSVVAVYPFQLEGPDWQRSLLQQVDSVLDKRLRDYRKATQGYLQRYAEAYSRHEADLRRRYPQRGQY